MKKSQKDFIKAQLAQYGEVSRNTALANGITRLSAIMLNLKNEGLNFTTFDRGGDYVYSTGEPKKVEPKKTFVVVNGRQVNVADL